MKPILFAGITLLFAVISLRAPLAAQTHSPSPRAEGELKGLVLDPNEARIVGATITVRNEKHSFEIESNDEGAYQIKLPSGEYQLIIKNYGFKAYIRNRVRIEAGKTKTIDATLQVSPSVKLRKVN